MDRCSHVKDCVAGSQSRSKQVQILNAVQDKPIYVAVLAACGYLYQEGVQGRLLPEACQPDFLRIKTAYSRTNAAKPACCVESTEALLFFTFACSESKAQYPRVIYRFYRVVDDFCSRS
jgi:hypothetical protein